MEESLLKLAEQSWEAEEENARRIAARSNILVTIAGTLIAVSMLALRLGVFSERPDSTTVQWAVFLSVVLTLALLFYALAALLIPMGATGGAPTTASQRLILTPSEAMAATALLKDEALEACWTKTYVASKDLYRQNRDARDRIDSGQQSLLLATLTAGIAIVVYTASKLL